MGTSRSRGSSTAGSVARRSSSRSSAPPPSGRAGYSKASEGNPEQYSSHTQDTQGALYEHAIREGQASWIFTVLLYGAPHPHHSKRRHLRSACLWACCMWTCQVAVFTCATPSRVNGSALLPGPGPSREK